MIKKVLSSVFDDAFITFFSTSTFSCSLYYRKNTTLITVITFSKSVEILHLKLFVKYAKKVVRTLGR